MRHSFKTNLLNNVLLATSSVSALAAVSSKANVYGSAVDAASRIIDPQEDITISLTCGLDLLEMNSTIANTCGPALDLTSLQSATVASLSSLSQQQYWQLCTAGCQSTLTNLSATLTSSDCASNYFDSANSINGSDISTYLTLATSVMCLKTADTNGYCLFEQMPTLIPLLTSLSSSGTSTSSIVSDLFNEQDRSVICTDCLRSELAIIQPNLGTLSAEGLLNASTVQDITLLQQNFGLICLFGVTTITATPFAFVPMTTTTTTTTTPTTLASSTQTNAVTFSPPTQTVVASKVSNSALKSFSSTTHPLLLLILSLIISTFIL